MLQLIRCGNMSIEDMNEELNEDIVWLLYKNSTLL